VDALFEGFVAHADLGQGKKIRPRMSTNEHESDWIFLFVIIRVHSWLLFICITARRFPG